MQTQGEAGVESPFVTRYRGLVPRIRRNPFGRRPSDVVAFALATWFGCGLVPKAPGTMGSIGAIPLWLLLAPMGNVWVAVAVGGLTVVGVWASQRVADLMGQRDPQLVVIDEVIGVMIAWIAAPHTWLGGLAGLVLFRLFDITKPVPCRWCERHFSPGVSIVLDDICAGIWAAAVLVAGRLAFA